MFYLQRRGGHGCDQSCQCKYSKDGVKLQIFVNQGFGPTDNNYHCCTCVETRCNCGNCFADIPGQNYRVRDCLPCGCSCGYHYNQQTRNFECNDNCPPPPSNCFPARARVSLKSGKSVTMSKLQEGDQIQTGKIYSVYGICLFYSA